MNKSFGFKSILLIPVILLVLTGCVKEEASISVNEDGSSDVEATVTISKDNYDYLASLDPENKLGDDSKSIASLFEKEIEKFEKNGFNVEIINSSIEVGYRVSKSYITSSDFNKDIKKLNDDKLIKSDIQLQTKRSIYKSKFKIEGKIAYLRDKKYDKLVNEIKEIDKNFKFNDNYSLRLTINLPGEIKKINNKKTTWDINSRDDNYTKIYIESGVINKKFVVVASISFCLALVILAITLVRVFRR